MLEQETLAIQDVLTRYATGIDRRDWSLFRTCFTEDLVADYGDFGLWKSPDEITDFMEYAHREMGHTLHRLSNFSIQIDGEAARARTYVDALLTPGPAGGEIHRGIGYYDDELVKTGDGWKIRKRHFVAVHVV
jgi:hypothetical protein